MKKFLISTLFLLTLSSIWCQSLCFFSKITLDMNEDAVVNVLNTEFKGKYTINKAGDYLVTIDNNKKLYITVYDEKIYTLRIVIHNAVFSQFVNCLREIISKRGEPDTCRPNGFEYRVEWYGNDSDPGWALVFSDEAPYSLEEILTYEK